MQPISNDLLHASSPAAYQGKKTLRDSSNGASYPPMTFCTATAGLYAQSARMERVGALLAANNHD